MKSVQEFKAIIKNGFRGFVTDMLLSLQGQKLLPSENEAAPFKKLQ